MSHGDAMFRIFVSSFAASLIGYVVKPWLNRVGERRGLRFSLADLVFGGGLVIFAVVGLGLVATQL